jgi:hypothetical protein
MAANAAVTRFSKSQASLKPSQKPENYPNYMNAHQCGQFIGGRTAGAIRNLVMRRQIPYRKVGGRLVFLKSEIIEWLDRSPGLRPEDLSIAN